MREELLTFSIDAAQMPQMLEAMGKAGYRLFEAGTFPNLKNHVILTFEAPAELLENEK